jgi:adenylate cyclase
MLLINNNSINEMPNRINNYMSEMPYFNSNSYNDQKEILVPQKVYNWLDEEKIYLYYIDKNRYEYNSFISDEGTLGPVALFHDNNNNKDICIKKIERPYETCTRGKKSFKINIYINFLKRKFR